MPTPRTLVVGETLVDFFPPDGDPLSADNTFQSRPGGAPANVAVGLARLGHPPWFWTRVGDDPFGESLERTLEDHGVHPRFVERDPDAPTTLAFVGGGDSDRQFHFYRDSTADTRLQPETVPDSTLEAIEWLALGGVVVSAEPARSAAFDLVERAREADCSVLLDPNYRPELWTEHEFAGTMERLLSAVDVLKATPAELRAMGLVSETDEHVQSVFDAGPHTLFRTRGGEAALADADERSPWGPESVERAPPDVGKVDPTGAGDAFVAGVLTAILDGEPSLAGILDIGLKIGAVATTGRGAMTALPRREELEETIGRR